MAYEAIAAIGSYIYEIFAGASVAEGAGAAAEVGSAAAGAAGATTWGEALATSSAAAAGTTGAATYAAMAAQALGGAAAVQSSLNQSASAEFNAKMGISNAEQAAMQAGAAEDAQRRRAGIALGEGRAAMAQSGVDPTSGSGLLVEEQSARNAELDALTVRYQGLLEGRGLLAQSALDQRQAAIYSQNAVYAGLGGALGTYGAYKAGQGTSLLLRSRPGGYLGGY